MANTKYKFTPLVDTVGAGAAYKDVEADLRAVCDAYGVPSDLVNEYKRYTYRSKKYTAVKDDTDLFKLLAIRMGQGKKDSALKIRNTLGMAQRIYITYPGAPGRGQKAFDKLNKQPL